MEYIISNFIVGTNLIFKHIKEEDNTIVDVLSRWVSSQPEKELKVLDYIY